MHFHSNATTNFKQRLYIQQSHNSYRDLAAQFQVSLGTIHHWKHHSGGHDRSCRPHTIHTNLSYREERLVLWMRQTGQLPLDDLLAAAQLTLPHLRRSSLHRLLVRNGCSRLAKTEQQPTGQAGTSQGTVGTVGTVGTFKEYGPGFVHIDCFYLPQLEGQKHYCFVAIDRATRLVFLHVYQNKDKEAATDFLKRCLAFYPFQVEKILTDNGREFTLAGFKNRWGTKTTKVHPFTQLCQDNAIEHRQTRPYTPKTNGMVERVNGLIKEGTTKKHRYQNAQQMKDDLNLYFVQYNFYRRHRRIGRITPYEALCRWYHKQPELFLRQPTELLAYRSQPPGT